MKIPMSGNSITTRVVIYPELSVEKPVQQDIGQGRQPERLGEPTPDTRRAKMEPDRPDRLQR